MNFLASIGFGMYASGNAIYFTRYVGLPVSQVGIGLTVAGLVWLPLSIHLGRFADKVGARGATVFMGVAQVLLLVAATAVHGLVEFVVVVSLLGVFVQGGWICREALVAEMTDSEARVTVSAYLRSAFNVGIILGALAAGLALTLDDAPAYLALILGSALAEAAATVLCLGLPKRAAGPEWRADVVPIRNAVRDVPYLTLSVLYGLLAVGDIVLRIGIPLWIVTHSGLPSGLGAWLYGLNAVLVVALQVPLSRAAETFGGVRRLLLLASFASTVSCLAIAVSTGMPALVGVSALVVSVVLLSLSEVWSSAAGWKLRYELAPPQAQGTWGGVFALGSSINLVLGPAVVTLVVERYAATGWAALSAGFLLVAAAVVPAMAWALRTRATGRAGAPREVAGSPQTKEAKTKGVKS
ncbi:MFS transporter [Streptomyces angustmyceticus]|uniref:MFS transporter n=1 Tax=Streptomyces angustmyceticus TaxID=285578 RepID=UPI000A38FA07|nr:MFS transporter [Streptomyces angustmyceticus]UAL67395.1 MFS transporter [Streptomyces angustmyceticus]